MAKTAVISSLGQYVNPTNPLGPIDAQQLTDAQVGARLFDPHNKSFNNLLRRDVSVVIGRRGSGKTALLNSYKYWPYLDSMHPKLIGHDYQSDVGAYEIVIDVVPYKVFERMQRRIVGDRTTFRPVEAIVDDWTSLITEYFLAKLVAGEMTRGRLTDHIKLIHRYLHQAEDDTQQEVRREVWGAVIWKKLSRFLPSRSQVRDDSPLSLDEALAFAVSHLLSIKKRAVIVFDSMDEYDVTDDRVTRTLGALIRFIAHFNTSQDRIKIKLGFPSEIYPELSGASANPLKDLVVVNQLRWSALELAQLAAHRFRLFLELHDSKHARTLSHFDFSNRDHVWKFWATFFPPSITNRYGTEEEPIIYILRHTQLLPRQFLMILQRIMITSADETGGFRELKAAAITEAIETIESLIAKEILVAFRFVYRFALALCNPVFANFPTVFSYDELEDRWRKKGRPVAHRRSIDFEMPEFSEMVVRMGIVGVGDANSETTRYYRGRFGYDALAPTSIGEGHTLCLHPIFSRLFNSSRNALGKPVIPQGVTIRPSDEDE